MDCIFTVVIVFPKKSQNKFFFVPLSNAFISFSFEIKSESMLNDRDKDLLIWEAREK